MAIQFCLCLIGLQIFPGGNFHLFSFPAEYGFGILPTFLPQSVVKLVENEGIEAEINVEILMVIVMETYRRLPRPHGF